MTQDFGVAGILRFYLWRKLFKARGQRLLDWIRCWWRHEDVRRLRGRRGERLAERFLRRQGYKLVMRNYRLRQGEIDLIMRDGETLVFVEVKMRQSEEFVATEKVVHFAKQQHLRRAAQRYIYQTKSQQRPCRFDVVVVLGEGRRHEIKHYTNAFRMS